MKKTITLLLVLIITSCVTRKSNVSKTENKIDTEVSAKETENKTTESKETAKVESDTKKTETENESELVIEPIDNTKPSSATIDGKTYDLNNAKLTNRNIKRLKEENTKLTLELERTKKELLNKKKDVIIVTKRITITKDKQTERKSTLNLFFLGLGLGFLISFMVWLGWKYKDKLFS